MRELRDGFRAVPLPPRRMLRRLRARLPELAPHAHVVLDADAGKARQDVVHGAVRVRGDEHGLPDVHERAHQRRERRRLPRAG